MTTTVVILVAVFLFIFCAVLIYLLINVTARFRKYREEEQVRTSSIRQGAIRDSRRVLGGKFTEQMVPYLPEFKYDPTDARFIGTPIDLIVFPGLAQDNPTEVVLIEVKSGQKSRLTPREQKIKEIVEAGKVRWELLYRAQPEEQ